MSPAPDGGMLGTRRTAGSRNVDGRSGGEPVVEWLWLIGTAVGFLLLMALVIWLARGSTARWERAKRAARAPRPAAGAELPSPGGVAARLRRALVAMVGLVPRLPGSAPERLRHVVGVLSSPRRLVPHVPAVRRLIRPLRPRHRERAPAGVPDVAVGGSGAGDGGADVVPGSPRRPRWTRTGAAVLRRRRAFRFPHRTPGDEGSEESRADLERGRERSAPGARAEDRAAPG